MDASSPGQPLQAIVLRVRTDPALRRTVPSRLDVATAEARGRRAWERNPCARQAALETMEAIVGASGRAGELEALARRWLMEANVHNVFFWRPWSAPYLDGRSRENLLAAASTGRGVLLSGCHVGPFFLAMGAVASVRAAPFATAGGWLYEQADGIWGRRIERWHRGVAERGEIMVRSGGAFERIAGLLEQGEVVRVHFDMPGSVQTSFLGKRVGLTGGTARLAMRTGALVLPIHTLRAGHRVSTTIEEALDPREHSGTLELHEALARVHEQVILHAPEQLESPNRPGAWEGGASAEAWIRPGDGPASGEEPAAGRRRPPGPLA